MVGVGAVVCLGIVGGGVFAKGLGGVAQAWVG